MGAGTDKLSANADPAFTSFRIALYFAEAQRDLMEEKWLGSYSRTIILSILVQY
jgi:hypothetical protein